jgi:thiol-disulfide isomerase/thioredoxin
MLKTSLISVLVLGTLFIQGCSKGKEEQHITTVAKTQPKKNPNEFTLQTLTNEPLTIEKAENGFLLKGEPETILLLDVFATWCPPCQASAAHLSSLQKKYKKKIKIVGVSIEDGVPRSALEEFQTQHNADYTLVDSPENRRLINTMAEQLKLGHNFGIPLLAIYKNGKLVRFYQGMVEEEFIESDIKQALGK